MAIDLLGESSHESKEQLQEGIELYVPEDEKKMKPQKIKKKIEVEKEIRDGDDTLDLSEDIKRKDRIVRVILRLVIMSVLVAGLGAGIFLGWDYYSNRQVQPNVVITPTPTAPEPTLPTPTTPESVTPEPTIPEPETPSGPLPDTPLVDLYGALVKFRDSREVFLVEKNGELRIITENVVFDNGNSLSEVKSSLIYVISDSWKATRRGQDVRGQVDFDPRVLSLREIRPFL